MIPWGYWRELPQAALKLARQTEQKPASPPCNVVASPTHCLSHLVVC